MNGLILWDDNNSYLLWNYGMVIIKSSNAVMDNI